MVWCRERWELLVGVVVGVLGMLAFTRGSRDTKEILEQKNILFDTILESEAEASEQEREALRRNLEKFLTENEQARAELKEELDALDDEKKSRVREILALESPEDEIAARLKEYLD